MPFPPCLFPYQWVGQWYAGARNHPKCHLPPAGSKESTCDKPWAWISSKLPARNQHMRPLPASHSTSNTTSENPSFAAFVTFSLRLRLGYRIVINCIFIDSNSTLFTSFWYTPCQTSNVPAKHCQVASLHYSLHAQQHFPRNNSVCKLPNTKQKRCLYAPTVGWPTMVSQRPVSSRSIFFQETCGTEPP